MILMFEMFISQGQSSHISSRSLDVGFLMYTDQQGAEGTVLVCFGVPPVDGICGCCGVQTTGGDFLGVFVVAAAGAATVGLVVA